MAHALDPLGDFMDEEFERADVTPLQDVGDHYIRLQWPFGWEGWHVDSSARRLPTDGRARSVILYRSPRDVRRRWDRRGLNDRLCFLIRRLLRIWGGQPPGRIHAGLGAEGGSPVIGGLIGRMHDDGELEKENGVWRHVGPGQLEEGVAGRAKANARAWSDGT